MVIPGREANRFSSGQRQPRRQRHPLVGPPNLQAGRLVLMLTETVLISP